MNRALTILAGIATALAAATLVTAVAADPPQPQGRLSGEVVAIRQHTATQNAGEIMEIQIRTRNREQHWVRLGPASAFDELVRVGDRVRVRTVAAAAGDTPQVQTMRNLRSGRRIQVRDGSGDMVRQRSRAQDGAAPGAEAGPGQGQGHGTAAGRGRGR